MIIKSDNYSIYVLNETILRFPLLLTQNLTFIVNLSFFQLVLISLSGEQDHWMEATNLENVGFTLVFGRSTGNAMTKS